MNQLLITVLATTILFLLAVLAMAVGLILRGKVMSGGCSSGHDPQAVDLSCDTCSKKKLNLCDSDDTTGLAGPSFAGSFGRFSKKH